MLFFNPILSAAVANEPYTNCSKIHDIENTFEKNAAKSGSFWTGFKSYSSNSHGLRRSLSFLHLARCARPLTEKAFSEIRLK